MKKIAKILKNRWAEYVIEILVIIIGISLSFFFNGVRENQIEQRQEIKLLQSIHENLAIDTLTLDSRLQTISVFLHGYEQMLSHNVDTFSTDSITIFLDFAASYVKFQGTALGYEELKQSKSSTIIKNRKLLQQIIQHYDQKYDLMSEWGDIDKSFVLDHMLPFLSKNMRFVEGPLLYNDAETTVKLLQTDNQFKNMIKSVSVYKMIMRIIYKQLKQDSESLMQDIEVELKKLK